MSDYISKSALIHKIRGFVPSSQDVDFIVRLIDEQPTLDEKEIIRKPFERVVEKLKENSNFLLHEMGEPKMYAGNESAIEILKEECGINE